ncbi:MAG: 4-hydroxy-2-oxoheptanedioate aldolase [Herpetosiphon sp.]
MRTNPLRARLAAGQSCRGLWLDLPGVATVRLLARLPLDWLLVDAEHAPLDTAMLATMVAAIADAGGPVPLVRVPHATVESIAYALDAGAFGIVVPMVNDAATAESVVRAVRFPPAGMRSFGGPYAPLAFNTDSATYRKGANQEIMVIVQIETVEAIHNLDAILSVPGVDMAFVGPNDLSISLGLEPSNENGDPRFTEALETILAGGKRQNVPIGIYCSDGHAAMRRVAQGFPFVSIGTDVGTLVSGVRNLIDQMQ